MKKQIVVTLAILLVSRLGFAQDVVCHTPATEKFAMFASNREFNKQHLNPRVYTHVSEEGGKMISFKTPDGTDAKAYLIMATSQVTVT